MPASRIRWYSLSVSVCAGATVIESPVWTPIGSKFSIEQMMTTLSFAVAHHLELVLLPADDRLLDEHLVHRARASSAAPRERLELLEVVGDAAALAAQVKRRADDDREARSRRRSARASSSVVGVAGLGHVEADRAPSPP